MTTNENLHNGTNEVFLPTHVASDYVQIIYLVVVFCIGAPLNVYTFVKLSRQYYRAKSRLLLLSLHLNVSDLMILSFYAFAKLCWLVTYKWMAGVVMCKIVRFTHALSVISSGNVVVCIGLDRLFSLLSPLQIKPKANRRCKQMLAVAWTMAFVCSTPQLHVWTVFEVAPDWYQCTDVWKVWQELNTTTAEAQSMKVGYRVFHLIFLFWLPFVILAIAYVIILKKVYHSLGEDRMQCRMVFTKSSDFSNQNVISNSNNKKRYWNSVPNLSLMVSRIPQMDSSPSLRVFGNTLTNNNNLQVSLLRRNVCHMQMRRRKHRTLKTTIGIVLAYVLCWLPYNLLEIWNIIDPESYNNFEDYVYFFYGLIVVNAMINPLIYSRLSFNFCHRLQGRKNKEDVKLDMNEY